MSRIQLRRDTAANWTAANPVLASGEKGVETDTGKEKTGDGITAWNSLAYFGAGGGPHTHPESDITNLVSDLSAKASTSSVTSAIATHEADTTAVHGITDTSTLYRAGGTDVAVADGGTGASTASAARTNLGLVIGTDVAAQSSIVNQAEVIGVALSDETTAITTGTAKATIRMPFAMTLTSVRANLNTASSSGIPTVNIKESGTTIFSTKLTIDASELTSTTAATPAVISDASLADDAEITFDIDVAGTGAKGLKVWLIGTRA